MFMISDYDYKYISTSLLTYTMRCDSASGPPASVIRYRECVCTKYVSHSAVIGYGPAFLLLLVYCFSFT